jgi:hypothetical protein
VVVVVVGGGVVGKREKKWGAVVVTVTRMERSSSSSSGRRRKEGKVVWLSQVAFQFSIPRLVREACLHFYRRGEVKFCTPSLKWFPRVCVCICIFIFKLSASF